MIATKGVYKVKNHDIILSEEDIELLFRCCYLAIKNENGINNLSNILKEFPTRKYQKEFEQNLIKAFICLIAQLISGDLKFICMLDNLERREILQLSSPKSISFQFNSFKEEKLNLDILRRYLQEKNENIFSKTNFKIFESLIKNFIEINKKQNNDDVVQNNLIKSVKLQKEYIYLFQTEEFLDIVIDNFLKSNEDAKTLINNFIDSIIAIKQKFEVYSTLKEGFRGSKRYIEAREYLNNFLEFIDINYLLNENNNYTDIIEFLKLKIYEFKDSDRIKR